MSSALAALAWLMSSRTPWEGSKRRRGSSGKGYRAGGTDGGGKIRPHRLNDDEIEQVASYLYVQYDRKELRLIFRDPS